MSIRFRLILGFNLFLIALALVGFLTLREISRSHDISSQIDSVFMARMEQASHIEEELSRLRSLELEYVATAEPTQRAQVRSQLAATLLSLLQGTTAYQQSLRDGQVPEDFRLFSQGYAEYLATHQQLLALADDGRRDAAFTLYADSAAQFRATEDNAHSLRHEEYAAAREATREGNAISDRARNILIAGLAALAVLILVVGHPSVTYIHRRLRALIEGAQGVARGDLDQRVAIGGRDEFGAVASAFNSMVESLGAARQEVAQLHAQALQMREERIALLQEGLTRVVKAQENERSRVARELHDQAGQGLTSLQLGLSRIEKAAPSPAIEEAAAALRALTVETMNVIRDLALDLRPSALDDLGLVPALRDFTKTFSSRLDIPIDFQAAPLDEELPEETKVTLFRIVQEGLTNIAKHAGASRALVSLEAQDSSLRLVIEDDGVGFNVERALGQEGHKSLGLFGMQERCHLLGGDLRITSQSGKGTKLVVTVPLAPAQDRPSTGLRAA